MRRIVTAVMLVVALLVSASPAFGFHEGNQPIGSCPSGWSFFEEGVDYRVVTDTDHKQPPWVTGEQVGFAQWMDRNDDGFACIVRKPGANSIVDNNQPL